jgi:hypothetical protein
LWQPKFEGFQPQLELAPIGQVLFEDERTKVVGMALIIRMSSQTVSLLDAKTFSKKFIVDKLIADILPSLGAYDTLGFFFDRPSNESDPGRFWAPNVPLEDAIWFPICRPCHSLDGA